MWLIFEVVLQILFAALVSCPLIKMCCLLALTFQLISLFAALQKAGKHMEDSVVAAYLSLLLGCILQENMVVFNNNKDNNISIIVIRNK